jgi:hypothetical protein
MDGGVAGGSLIDGGEDNLFPAPPKVPNNCVKAPGWFCGGEEDTPDGALGIGGSRGDAGCEPPNSRAGSGVVRSSWVNPPVAGGASSRLGSSGKAREAA